MKVKVLELRDVGTFVPVLCVDMNPDMVREGPHSDQGHAPNESQRYLLRRVGYPCDGKANIALTRLDAGGGSCWNDPYGWTGRTFPVAHKWIIEHWSELSDGDVVDVEFILGERTTPKISERFG